MRSPARASTFAACPIRLKAGGRVWDGAATRSAMPYESHASGRGWCVDEIYLSGWKARMLCFPWSTSARTAGQKRWKRDVMTEASMNSDWAADKAKELLATMRGMDEVETQACSCHGSTSRRA